MPRKKSTVDPRKRIRENQRRSRARQKELVESLQQQLRKYEEKELQATLVMQMAARRVAWENAQLRALLVSRGVSRQSIDSFLSQQERLEIHSITNNDPREGPSIGNIDQMAENTPIKELCTQDQIAPGFNRAQIRKTSAASSGLEPGSQLGTMSCEMAADIISGMRGNGDSEQVRSQLGCLDREDCNVNNIRVMQVMEMD